MNDPINPDHYQQHPAGVECVDVAEHFGYNLGNAIKYIWRHGRKPGADVIEDLQKAAWFINREIDRVARTDPQVHGPDRPECRTLGEVPEEVRRSLGPG